jgi:hypothetical protein
MTRTAWQLLAAIGLATCFVATSCVITTTDDDDDNTPATGGSAGATTGGSAGAATGGSAGDAAGGVAGAATGGAGGAGGAGLPEMCNASDTPKGTPGTAACTEAEAQGDACVICIYANACAEWNACGATEPKDQCAEGGPAGGDGEFWCMVDCINDPTVTGDDELIGGDPADPDTAAACEAYCATSACGATLGGVTNTLYSVVVENCLDACFPTP